MSIPFPLVALSDRLAQIIKGLCGAVASQAAAHPPLAPLLMLVWNRIGRMARRFASLAASAGPRASAPHASSPHPSGSPSSASRERLPGWFAWLVRLVPEAACYGSQLQHLLSDADVAACLAAARPGAGRVLRPLCWMLGVAPGPALSAERKTPPARDKPLGRERRSDPTVPGAAKARRSRVPRSFGRPWLRWHPTGDAV